MNVCTQMTMITSPSFNFTGLTGEDSAIMIFVGFKHKHSNMIVENIITNNYKN